MEMECKTDMSGSGYGLGAARCWLLQSLRSRGDESKSRKGLDHIHHAEQQSTVHGLRGKRQGRCRLALAAAGWAGPTSLPMQVGHVSGCLCAVSLYFVPLRRLTHCMYLASTTRSTSTKHTSTTSSSPATPYVTWQSLLCYQQHHR